MDPILGVFFAICLEYTLFCFISFLFSDLFSTFVKPCHFFRQPNIQLGVICTYLCLQYQVLFCSFLQFPFVVLENVVLHVFDIFLVMRVSCFFSQFGFGVFFPQKRLSPFLLYFFSVLGFGSQSVLKFVFQQQGVLCSLIFF